MSQAVMAPVAAVAADVQIKITDSNGSYSRLVSLKETPAEGTYEAVTYIMLQDQLSLLKDGTEQKWSESSKSSGNGVLSADFGTGDPYYNPAFPTGNGPAGYVKFTARKITNGLRVSMAATDNPDEISDAVMPRGWFVVERGGVQSRHDLIRIAEALAVKGVSLEPGDKCWFEFDDNSAAYASGFTIKDTGIGGCDMSHVNFSDRVDDYRKMSVDKAGVYDLNYFRFSKKGSASTRFQKMVVSYHNTAFLDPAIKVVANGKETQLDYFYFNRACEKLIRFNAGDRLTFLVGENEAINLQNADFTVMNGATVSGYKGVRVDSDAADASAITIPTDGYYRVIARFEPAKRTEFNITVAPANLPGKLYVVRNYCTDYVDDRQTPELTGAVIGELTMNADKPGTYSGKVPMNVGLTFFLTEDASRPQLQADGSYACVNYGSTYPGHGNDPFCQFQAGKPVYAVATNDEFKSKSNDYWFNSWHVTETSVPYDFVEGEYDMTFDMTASADRSLTWGPLSDFNGQDYSLIFGRVNQPADYGENPDKYKFIYHPDTNLYTLTLEKLWGPIRIDNPALTGNHWEYTGSKGNHIIYNLNQTYDLWRRYDMTGMDYEFSGSWDEQQKAQRENAFAINDPEYADGLETMDNDWNSGVFPYGDNQYYYYKDVTLVFDPMSSRLWVEKQGKQPIGTPQKESPVYIVFVKEKELSEKVSASNYEILASHELYPTGRYGYYTSDGYISVPSGADDGITTTVKADEENRADEDYSVVYYFFSEGNYPTMDELNRKALHFHSDHSKNAADDHLKVDNRQNITGVQFNMVDGDTDSRYFEERSYRNANTSARPGHVHDATAGQFFAVGNVRDEIFVEFDRGSAHPWSRLTRRNDTMTVVIYDPMGNTHLDRVDDADNFRHVALEADKENKCFYGSLGSLTERSADGLTHFFLTSQWIEGKDLRYNMTHSINACASDCDHANFDKERDMQNLDIHTKVETFLDKAAAGNGPAKCMTQDEKALLRTNIVDFTSSVHDEEAVIYITLAGGTDIGTGETVDADRVRIAFNRPTGIGQSVGRTYEVSEIHDLNGLQVATSIEGLGNAKGVFIVTNTDGTTYKLIR